ncbi:MAG: (d)CMP kinase [Lachnospiraceae bacterium]|nr:(d)CMP kinase [Lachnospiraceae bacterium]
MAVYNIAIDGPAGAGKSTIAKLAAKKLGFIYVDTGAMYRALALYFIRKGIQAEETEKLAEALKEADVSIRYEAGEQIVLLNGENVNAYIRTEEVGKMTSVTSALAMVREKLLELQRKLATEQSVLMDGRDIGTTVLPDADLKIYLTADAGVRAERRYKELVARGESCDRMQIERDIILRDQQDMSRAVSPLRKAEDAILVDASFLTIDEVTEKILSLFEEAKKQKGK